MASNSAHTKWCKSLGVGAGCGGLPGFRSTVRALPCLEVPARGPSESALLCVRGFKDEARLASTLNHPNVCTIYDVGDREGRPFIAMELLEGATLERLLGRGALPLTCVLSYAIQIARALDAAHGSGIVRRNVKPGNIFITDRQVVKVTDFGSQQRPAAGSRPAPNSAEALVAGTSGYIHRNTLRGKKPAQEEIFSHSGWRCMKC